MEEGAGKDLDNEGVTGRQVQGEDVPIEYGKSDDDLLKRERCNERKEEKEETILRGKRKERGEFQVLKFLKLGNR